MNDLNRKLQRLKVLKEDTKSRMSAKLQHPRKKLKEKVQLWLKDVDRINEEIQDLQQNYFKKIGEVDELLQQGKCQDSLVVEDLGWIEQALCTTTFIGDASKMCMEEIWAYLMDDGFSKIGVWGMGGSGKTTIMELINNQLLKEIEKFDTVIWITISEELNIFKLQDSTADAMQVDLPKDEYEAIRARIIYQGLSQKDKYVLILDDLWDKLSLEEVGIPEPSNGSKLVVTTRSLDVCYYLGCQVVRMPTLSKSDAWRLFSEKVGERSRVEEEQRKK
ncbi:probable disease resistance protein At5g43740 [Durio zibethinus]|uniref:Probable disease resistance protein At5g43740 n=1 Tax=Durio zibethinus TaxID=66656 RepID=A0A6P5WNL6_DURZI|nr:probable disease resistance protein At5g43740 [Durio zibethinus]